MDRKSKILLIILISLITYAVGSSYYRFFIARDYQIIAEISCDPETEKCFVWEEEGEEPYYYKKINKNASNIPVCDPNIEECEELFCEEDEENCEIIFCDVDLVGDEEFCSES